MRKSLKKALSLGLAAAMAVSLGSGINAEAATLSWKDLSAKAPSYTTTPYHAYLGFQTSLYNFRNGFDEGTYGAAATADQTKELKNVYQTTDATAKGASSFDWHSMFFYNAPDGTATKKSEFRDLNADGTKDNYDVPNKTKLTLAIADFKNPDVTYDGTYTVTMSNFNENVFKYDYGFRMLYVSTTIPLTVKDVKFTNVSLKVDGTEVSKADTGVIRNASDSPNCYTLMLANEYGYKDYGCKGETADTNKNDGVADPIWEAAKTNGGVINMPKKSIEVTFTVSGLGEKPAGYVAKDDDAVAASTAAIVASQQAVAATETATETAVTSLKKGKTFTAGNLTYKVTKASSKSGSATVAVAGVKKSAQKKTSLSVPKTVTNKKFKYKVTAVNSKAFSKCAKLKKISLGSNVKTIEKNAFKGCKNLKALNAGTKLTKVAKGAFAGCKQNIKVSGASKKANVKTLKKSGYKKFK